MKLAIKSLCLCCLLPLPLTSAPFQFVSHAGNASSAPAHSIPAYKAALANQADILKLDIRFTKDNVIVMQHDATLKRMMDWDVKISQTTYQEILEKGIYKKKQGYDREKIVTLDQALELVKDSPMQLWLDTKFYSPQIVEDAIALLKKHGVPPERVMFATFSIDALQYVRDHHPEYRRVLHISVPALEDGYSINFEKTKTPHTADEIKQILKAKAQELKLYGYNFPMSSPLLGKDVVQFLKQQGLWVSLWFVQNEEQARKAIEVGGNAGVTDYIQTVKPVIRAAENAQ